MGIVTLDRELASVLMRFLARSALAELARSFARDTRLDRDVAVKVIHQRLAADPDRISRFEKEARAAARLDHPNVLNVHDVGIHDGCPYLVTELLEGEPLRVRLDAPLPPRKAIDIVLQAAQGLAAAHEKGIVHRDIKTENSFITKDGHVKILDFTLIDAAGKETAQTSLRIAPRARLARFVAGPGNSFLLQPPFAER